MAERRQRDRRLWGAFLEERQRQWCRNDGLTAAVLVLAVGIVTLRVEHQMGPWEALGHALLVMVAMLMLFNHQMEGYTLWRNAGVVFLRLGMSTSTLLRKHALLLLAGEPASETLLWIMPGAVLRVLVGDHTALLALLGWGLPVGSFSNIAVQLASTWLVCLQNTNLCMTPFMKKATAAMMQDPLPGISAVAVHTAGRYVRLPLLRWLLTWLSLPTEEQICRWYTLGMQFTLGFAVPCLYWVCSDARAAVHYARWHRISTADSTYGMYRWLCRYLCFFQRALFWLLAVVSATLVACAAAGLSVLQK